MQDRAIVKAKVGAPALSIGCTRGFLPRWIVNESKTRCLEHVLHHCPPDQVALKVGINHIHFKHDASCLASEDTEMIMAAEFPPVIAAWGRGPPRWGPAPLTALDVVRSVSNALAASMPGMSRTIAADVAGARVACSKCYQNFYWQTALGVPPCSALLPGEVETRCLTTNDMDVGPRANGMQRNLTYFFVTLRCKTF